MSRYGGVFGEKREKMRAIGATASELSLSDAALLPAEPCQLQMRNFRDPVKQLLKVEMFFSPTTAVSFFWTITLKVSWLTFKVADR